MDCINKVFRDELKFHLDEVDIDQTSLTRNSPQGWLYVVVSCLLFYLFLYLFVVGSSPFLVSVLLGVFLSLHSQYLTHESVHRCLTGNKRIDDWISAYSTGVISFSEFVVEHRIHHSSTNEIEKDQDYFNFMSLFRINHHQELKFWHQYQHHIFYILGPVIASVVLLRRLCLSPMAAYKVVFWTFWMKLVHYLVWGVFFLCLNVWPFILFGFTFEAVWCAVIPRLIQWYFFINVFQWNHLHSSTSQPLSTCLDDLDSKDYFSRVLLTTNNVDEANPITRFLLVGNQIQHHLMPNVSASKTKYLISPVNNVAKKFDLLTSNSVSIRDQLYRNYCFYKSMGKPS